MARKARKPVQHAVLIVGEGSTEEAFLRYLKSLYITRGCGVGLKIRNAHGKGPDHVVDFAIRQRNNADYDRVIALLDTDDPWPDKTVRRARQKGIKLIGSTPCIEGLLLRILNQPVPEQSANCKQRIARVINEKLIYPGSYNALFTHEVLEARRVQISELNELLNGFVKPVKER